MRHKWCLHERKGRTPYAQANIKADGRWARVLLHRFILGAAAGQTVDHRDGDGLNDTRENLRYAVGGNNQHNSKPRAGTSRFKGVSRKTRNRWVAQIMAGQEYRYLGLHATEEDAARAYDRAARELHGEFARLNFPEPVRI